MLTTGEQQQPVCVNKDFGIRTQWINKWMNCCMRTGTHAGEHVHTLCVYVCVNRQREECFTTILLVLILSKYLLCHFQYGFCCCWCWCCSSHLFEAVVCNADELAGICSYIHVYGRMIGSGSVWLISTHGNGKC